MIAARKIAKRTGRKARNICAWFLQRAGDSRGGGGSRHSARLLRPSLRSLGIAGFKIPQWEFLHGHLMPGSEYERLSVATFATHDHKPIRALVGWRPLMKKRRPANKRGTICSRSRSLPGSLRGNASNTSGFLSGDFERSFGSESWIALVMITDLLGAKNDSMFPGPPRRRTGRGVCKTRFRNCARARPVSENCDSCASCWRKPEERNDDARMTNDLMTKRRAERRVLSKSICHFILCSSPWLYRIKHEFSHQSRRHRRRRTNRLLAPFPHRFRRDVRPGPAGRAFAHRNPDRRSARSRASSWNCMIARFRSSRESRRRPISTKDFAT